MLGNFELEATNAKAARTECHSRWPLNDVQYYGFDSRGVCVLMSLVRGHTKGNVATCKMNRSEKPSTFRATPVPLP